MCGIAGILRYTPAGPEAQALEEAGPAASIPFSWLQGLDNGIAFRGPDDSGIHRDRTTLDDGSIVDLAFVHRRLAIIDPDHGAQPLKVGGASFKGRLAAVFNGCIYNHKSLRADLTAGKHRFETHHADGEVILHGYREWAPELAQRLEGMFAYAVWDARRSELVLTRDRAGEKPLYLAPLPDGSGQAFASTPAALINLLREVAHDTRVADPVKPSGVAEWLAVGNGRNTPVQSIHTVPPATRTRIGIDHGEVTVSVKAYWTPPAKRGSEKRLTAKTLDSVLKKVVAERLEADAPIGAMLSGGIDSSLVCLYAQKELLTNKKHLRTYSLRMPDPQYDESGFAEAVAQHLKTRHTVVDIESTAADDLIHLITNLGLPFGDSSLLPTYWLSQAMKKDVKVALSGDGADELFCGYDRYVAVKKLQSYGWLLRMIPKGWLSTKDPKSFSSKLNRLANAARRYGYADLVSIFPSEHMRDLLGEDADAWLGRQDGKKGPLDGAMHDFATYLPRDILTKVDTASMAVGLEVRAPFLDSRLIETALSEPLGSLMPGGKRKGLLRELARAYLPEQIVERPKMGFAIPISHWLREDYGNLRQLAGDLLGVPDPWPNIDVRIDRKAVKKLIDEHMKGKRDHGQRIYMLTVLAIWSQHLAVSANGSLQTQAAA